MNYLYYFPEGIFPYMAIAVFVVGTIYRLRQWLKVPVPLRINLAPAKNSWKGVIAKIAAEVVLFVSLLRSDRTLWAVVWTMHICGLVILLGSHTLGIVETGLSLWTSYTIPAGAVILYITACFSFPLVAALLYLLVKRWLVKEVRRISIFPDYLALFIILAHVGNGIYMTFFTDLDMADVIKWGLGLVIFHPHIVQGSWIFAVHCFTGFGLFLYFPFSKLFHPLGQIANRWTLTQKEEPLVERGAVVK
jgi:nitrate reductase gamma subunit